MTKYWNERRIRRMRERRRRAEDRALEEHKREIERVRTHTVGDVRKNSRLMLDALGLPLRRKMIARLVREGAMSLSKLAEPFGITLPSALLQLRVLERAGAVTTRKQGRTRLCSYNKEALAELSRALRSDEIVQSWSSNGA